MKRRYEQLSLLDEPTSTWETEPDEPIQQGPKLPYKLRTLIPSDQYKNPLDKYGRCRDNHQRINQLDDLGRGYCGSCGVYLDEAIYHR